MAFDILYREHYQAIFRFACRLVGQADDARDIAQETFLKLHRQLAGRDVPHRPRAWLYRVSANLCLNLQRQRQRRRELLQRHATEQPPPVAEPWDPVRAERKARFRAALTRLPERDRLLLNLYRDGLSYAEMAEIAGIKPTSVGQTLSRAIARLTRAAKEPTR